MENRSIRGSRYENLGISGHPGPFPNQNFEKDLAFDVPKTCNSNVFGRHHQKRLISMFPEPGSDTKIFENPRVWGPRPENPRLLIVENPRIWNRFRSPKRQKSTFSLITSFCRPASGPVPKENTFLGLTTTIYFKFSFKLFKHWLFCTTHTHTAPRPHNKPCLFTRHAHAHTQHT